MPVQKDSCCRATWSAGLFILCIRNLPQERPVFTRTDCHFSPSTACPTGARGSAGRLWSGRSSVFSLRRSGMHEMSPRRFNMRLGMTLFVIYLALYLGFVLINAFATERMEVTTLWGLNLALVYGFGLILAAFLLALIYGWFCRPDVDPTEAAEASQSDSATEAKS